MEDFRKFLQRNDALESNSSDSDSDDSFGSGVRLFAKPTTAVESNDDSSTTTTTILGARKHNGRERQPTRRPDPNIYNRNAVLARENRRKKKAYLETVERELEEARNANKTLLKALKRQAKASRRLEQEKRYFQNIVANRTEILNLVAALNARLPLQSPSSTGYPTSSQKASNASPADSFGTLNSSSSFDDPEPLSITFDDAVPTSENDFEPHAADAFNDSWDVLIKDEEFDLNPAPVTLAQSINIEHSYVATSPLRNFEDLSSPPLPAENAEESGICLHIARGKVSLEFCPSCHWKSCRTPPTQLLQDEAAVYA